MFLLIRSRSRGCSCDSIEHRALQKREVEGSSCCCFCCCEVFPDEECSTVFDITPKEPLKICPQLSQINFFTFNDDLPVGVGSKDGKLIVENAEEVAALEVSNGSIPVGHKSGGEGNCDCERWRLEVPAGGEGKSGNKGDRGKSGEEEVLDLEGVGDLRFLRLLLFECVFRVIRLELKGGGGGERTLEDEGDGGDEERFATERVGDLERRRLFCGSLDVPLSLLTLGTAEDDDQRSITERTGDLGRQPYPLLFKDLDITVLAPGFAGMVVRSTTVTGKGRMLRKLLVVELLVFVLAGDGSFETGDRGRGGSSSASKNESKSSVVSGVDNGAVVKRSG